MCSSSISGEGEGSGLQAAVGAATGVGVAIDVHGCEVFSLNLRITRKMLLYPFVGSPFVALAALSQEAKPFFSTSTSHGTSGCGGLPETWRGCCLLLYVC